MVRKFVKWDYDLRLASHVETVVDIGLPVDTVSASPMRPTNRLPSTGTWR